MRQQDPTNLAVTDRITRVLVDHASLAGSYELDDPRRIGLATNEIAHATHGDVTPDGDVRYMGVDIGQRCYRTLRKLVEQGLVQRTAPGSSPTRWRASEALLQQDAALLDALPPLVTSP